ncbi:unnamed protein product [Alopecurus aequalis]
MSPTAPPGAVFQPSGHQIIAQYLAPKALLGDSTTVPALVADDVDVFSAGNPAALPFHHSSSRDHGEVWGYFYGDYPTDDVRPVPGGCWARYGPEKEYVHGDGGATEAVAFRRRSNYRLNKSAAAFRAAAKRPGPKANMDCVVRKVFAKAPPPCSSEVEEIPASRHRDEEAGYSSDEDWRRVRCRIEEESGRKRGRFCLV